MAGTYKVMLLACSYAVLVFDAASVTGVISGPIPNLAFCGNVFTLLVSVPLLTWLAWTGRRKAFPLTWSSVPWIASAAFPVAFLGFWAFAITQVFEQCARGACNS